MAEISLTFKQGSGHDAPWVVIKAGSVDEASAILREIRDRHVFAGVKAAAQEFKSGKPAASGAAAVSQAVTTVLNTIPGSEVIQSAAPGKPKLPHQQPSPSADAMPPGMAYTPSGNTGKPEQQLPEGVAPKCEKCDETAAWKEGISKQGTPYSGWYCKQWHQVK